MKRIVASLTLLVGLASPSWGTTFYTSNSTANGYAVGNNANNCLTIGAPCLTFAGGQSKMASGDTLIVNDGTYNQTYPDTIVSAPSGGGTEATRTILKCRVRRLCTLNFSVFTVGFREGTTNWITLDGFVLNCPGGVCVTLSSAVLTDPYPHHIRVIDNEMIGGLSGNRYNLYSGYGQFNEFLNNYIHDCAEQCVYITSRNGIYRGNEIYRAGRNTSVTPQQCVTMQTSGSHTGTDNLFERNILHDCAEQGTERGIEAGSATRLTLRYNIFYDMVSSAVRASPNVGYLSDSTIEHNTIVINSAIEKPIELTNTGSTGNLIRNNIINNVGAGGTIAVCSGCGTQTTNLTSGTASDIFTNAAGNDYTLKTGSAAINAGTNIGLPFNGASPDQGAFETFVFATCSVEAGDASKGRITFTNNANPPLRPASAGTGFTFRKAGANDVITAITRTGDNRIDLTLTDAIVGGNAIDVSYSAGNLTDSALIGNSLNQPYLATLTNQSCTNNTGAAPSHLFIQAAFEFHGLRGTEAAPVIKPHAAAAENTSVKVVPGGKVRIRISVTCTTADCPATGFYPRYSRNAGGYSTVIPETFGADLIAFCGTALDADVPNSGALTTDQLSTSGTFVPGALMRTSNATPTVTLAQNNKTELEYCVAVDPAANVGDTYAVRLYQQDGTALDTYTTTPSMTVIGMTAGGGF